MFFILCSYIRFTLPVHANTTERMLMNEQFPHSDEQFEQQEPIQQHEKSPSKQAITAGTAGLVGHAFTRGVMLNTNFLPISANETVTPIEQSTNEPTATQVASTSETTDLTAMIEKASSAIVGVVNYKQTGNRFAENVQDVKSGTGSG